MKDVTSETSQYSLRSLFVATLVSALFVASIVALKQTSYRSPQQQAFEDVWGLDGSAMEDPDGLFAVNLCGNGILVDDRICAKIVICQEIQKLTIAQAQITDAGVRDVSQLTNLVNLNLNGCSAVTDRSVPFIGKMSALTELYLSNTGISQDGRDSLRHLLPDCNLHDE